MRQVVLLANLLFSFAGAVTIYVNSSFMGNSVSIETVGVLYAVSAILSMIALGKAGKTLARIGNHNFFFIHAAMHTVSLFLIIEPLPLPVHILAFVGYLFSVNMLLFSLNIFFEHLFSKKKRGKFRGTFLLLGNAGVLVGPMFAAWAIDKTGYIGMYTLSLVIFLIVALAMWFFLKKYTDAKYDFGKIQSALVHTLQERTLRNVIAANFILQFFYAWMIVYTPIYLATHLGFSWDSIAIIFTIMLVPFVALDYPLGKMADWLGSEKELTAIGFLIMAGSVFSLTIITHPSVLLIGALLFLSRVGAATVEAMTEIHFFKVARDSDPSLLALFSDLRPLAYVIAPLIGALAISLLPFKMIFAVLALILMVGFVVSFFLEKNTVWWTRAHKE